MQNATTTLLMIVAMFVGVWLAIWQAERQERRERAARNLAERREVDTQMRRLVSMGKDG